MSRIWVVAVAGAAALAATPAGLYGQPNVTLHVNPRWKSCAFQLSPDLTQAAWHQFTRDVGIVAYMRPLADARPLGARRFEVSVLQWQTGIDETSSAWNDTFVHPDSMHWLTNGARLPIPGLMVRAGLGERVDVAGYFTKNVQSNYGLWGGQLQYNVYERGRYAAAARLNLVHLFGPDDVAVSVYGADLVASGTYHVAGPITLSPYAGVTTMLSTAHESSAVVDLKDERTLGVMGSVGAVARISRASLAVEYNAAQVNALSFRVGVGF